MKPLCGSEEEKEKLNGLMWYDVVLLEDKQRFLKFEALFTFAELRQFYVLEAGQKKEQLRQRILKMRKQFLEFWCKTHKCRNINANLES